MHELPAHPISGPMMEERVTKVQGVEVLPEGYVELDPMLFKDDYEFLNGHLEELFKEDQRKTKENRRKQYDRRGLTKIRDVVIYEIDYIKQEATKILHQWFLENNGPMSRDLMSKHAKQLGIDLITFQRLHDAYLNDRNLFRKGTSKNLNEVIYNDTNRGDLRHHFEGTSKTGKSISIRGLIQRN